MWAESIQLAWGAASRCSRSGLLRAFQRRVLGHYSLPPAGKPSRSKSASAAPGRRERNPLTANQRFLANGPTGRKKYSTEYDREFSSSTLRARAWC